MFGLGFSGMRTAVRGGDLQKVERLLGRGADPNASDSGGYTALHIAAINNRSEIIHALVIAGANVNQKDRSGTTPFELAVRGGQPEAVDILLDAGAVMHDINGVPAREFAWTRLDACEADLKRRNTYRYTDPTLIRVSGVVDVLRKYDA